jgi:hypothetical protein
MLKSILFSLFSILICQIQALASDSVIICKTQQFEAHNKETQYEVRLAFSNGSLQMVSAKADKVQLETTAYDEKSNQSCQVSKAGSDGSEWSINCALNIKANGDSLVLLGTLDNVKLENGKLVSIKKDAKATEILGILGTDNQFKGTLQDINCSLQK